MGVQLTLIDFNKCRPEECEDGLCLAAQACERRLLVQESSYEAPMPHPSLCKGCGDCVRACPREAVLISRV